MPSWPGTLPQRLRAPGLSASPGETRIATAMEVGVAKVRQRSTVASEPLDGDMVVTGAQLATFRAFFTTTLQGGALTFDWVEPETLGSVTLRFRPRELPSWSSLGADLWQLNLPLEKMP